MNFNPQNEQTLSNLLIALRGGLSGSQGYDILQDTMAQQQQQNEMRRQRYQSLADLVMSAGQQGYSANTAEMMADAQTPGRGLPGRTEHLIDLVYPDSAARNASGAPMDFPTGSRVPYQPGATVGTGPTAPVGMSGIPQGGQSFSPLYTEQVALQPPEEPTAPVSVLSEQDWMQVESAVITGAQQGDQPNDIFQKITAANPGIASSPDDLERLTGIIDATFTGGI